MEVFISKSESTLYELISIFSCKVFSLVALLSGFISIKGDDEVDGEVEEEITVNGKSVIAIPDDKVITAANKYYFSLEISLRGISLERKEMSEFVDSLTVFLYRFSEFQFFSEHNL